jgi:hypothetical protein
MDHEIQFTVPCSDDVFHTVGKFSSALNVEVIFMIQLKEEIATAMVEATTHHETKMFLSEVTIMIQRIRCSSIYAEKLHCNAINRLTNVIAKNPYDNDVFNACCVVCCECCW